jgi:3-oxoadipate enol-lactonase
MAGPLNFSLSGREDGPGLVLLHALGATNDLWWPQLGALGGMCRVVNVDLQGHGSSAMPKPGASVSNLADAVAALICEITPAGAHVAGISTGGMIAQSLAIEHPELVISLALCNTTSVVPHQPPATANPALFVSGQLVVGAAARARSVGMGAIAPIAVERWFRPAFRDRDPVSVGRVERMILGNQPEGYARVCEAISRFDVTDRLSEVRVPTLVVAGSHDPGTPLSCARVIVDAILEADLVVIEDSAHISNVERPLEFTAALAAFLQQRATR